MRPSLRSLEEAIAIRRQIDTLERRLAQILRGARIRETKTSRRWISPATRTKLAAAARARWARIRTARRARHGKKKGGISPAGRKRLSELMKARWAARHRSAVGDTRPPPRRK